MPPNPLDQHDTATLEAELRQALQHLRAAQAQAAETREALRETMLRARGILDRGRSPGDTPLTLTPASAEPPDPTARHDESS
jgi:hypothetical protein